MNGKPQQTFQTDYILILKVELRMNGYVSDLILSQKTLLCMYKTIPDSRAKVVLLHICTHNDAGL